MGIYYFVKPVVKKMYNIFKCVHIGINPWPAVCAHVCATHVSVFVFTEISRTCNELHRRLGKQMESVCDQAAI